MWRHNVVVTLQSKIQGLWDFWFFLFLVSVCFDFKLLCMLYISKINVCIFNTICLSVSASLSVTTSSHVSKSVNTVRSLRELFSLSQNVFYRSGLKHQQTFISGQYYLTLIKSYLLISSQMCMHVEDNSSHRKKRGCINNESIADRPTR